MTNKIETSWTILKKKQLFFKLLPVAVVLCLLGGCVFLLINSGWITDDAYISFRSVDNAVNGYGLRWNGSERVQGFTNTLWTLLLIVPYTVTREIYYTSIVTQILMTVVALFFVSTWVARSNKVGIVIVVTLLLSKAFIDYSTSGLENPLSHLTLAGFYYVLVRSPRTFRALGVMTLFLSLTSLTRMDNAIIVVLPWIVAAVQTVRKNRSSWRRRLVIAVAVGASPLVAWEIFSLLYFGFPFPNTAYAKLSAGLPSDFYWLQGFHYLKNSFNIDPLTLIVTVLGTLSALFIGAMRRDWIFLAAATGVLFHIFYIARVGGDFMSGRLLTPTLFAAVTVFAAIEFKQEWSAAVIALLVVLGAAALGQFPTLSDDYRKNIRFSKDRNGITDARRDLARVTSFSEALKGADMPRHRWVARGKRLRMGKEKVTTAGGIGFTGYYAGPEVQIMDMFALTDALLARLPHETPSKIPKEKLKTYRPRIGHLVRSYPVGYRESLASDSNQIEDPDLAKYYDKLRQIIRGPIWRADRFESIIKMNLGFYDHLLGKYNARRREIMKARFGE